MARLLVRWRSSIHYPCLSFLTWGKSDDNSSHLLAQSCDVWVWFWGDYLVVWECVSPLLLQNRLLSAVYTDKLRSSGINMNFFGPHYWLLGGQAGPTMSFLGNLERKKVEPMNIALQAPFLFL